MNIIKKDFAELKKNIEEALKSMDLIVDEITFRTENKLNFLEIVLDHVNGIDLDMIVEATHIIDPIVDKANISEKSFVMDVISKEKGV